jgi:hypothetical protein
MITWAIVIAMSALLAESALSVVEFSQRDRVPQPFRRAPFQFLKFESNPLLHSIPGR